MTTEADLLDRILGLAPLPVDELSRDLKQKGIPILYDENHPAPNPQNSPYAVYFEDPDRIKVELVAE